jgi:hypothetical protein
MNLPQARKDHLLTTQLEEEVIVYDPERKQAHSLNRTAVAVWNYADGQTSMADMQQRVSADIGAPISEAAVWLALRKLERAHLLAEGLASTEPITRRRVLSQAGRFGAAAMIATPIVLSATVPAAAAAASCSAIQGVFQCGTGCVCVKPAGENTRQCFTTAASGTKAHGTICASDSDCGAGSTCKTDTATGTLWCTCNTTSDCPGSSKCIPDGFNFCHTPCASSTCICPP